MGEGLVWLCGFAVTRVQQLLLTLQPHTHTPSTSSYPSNGSRRIRSAVLMHFQYSNDATANWPDTHQHRHLAIYRDYTSAHRY